MEHILKGLVASRFGGGGEKLAWTEPAKTVEDKTTITWDGNTEGLVVSTCSSSTPPKFYKVAELPMDMTTEELYALDCAKMTIDGVVVSSNTDGIFNDYPSRGGIRFLSTASDPQIAIARFDDASTTCEYYGLSSTIMSFPQAGIYARADTSSGKLVATEFSFTIMTNIPEVVHTIDPKYIKDMYYEETVWSPVVDFRGIFTAEALWVAYSEYENGTPFKAVINGEEYYEFTRVNGGTNNEVYYSTSDGKYSATANMKNLSVSHNAESWEWYTGETIVHTIPPKYLPYATIDVKQSMLEDGSGIDWDSVEISTSLTMEEMYEHWIDGGMVRVVPYITIDGNTTAVGADVVNYIGLNSPNLEDGLIINTSNYSYIMLPDGTITFA